MILLTGGSGLLGSELRSHLDCYAPTRQELDITKPFKIPSDTKLIVHCAAYTDVEGAESNQLNCYKTNVEAVENLAKHKIPMVYISTEYVFDGAEGGYHEEAPRNPVNYYAKTKMWGEDASQLTESLILRVLFKPRPWKYPKAFVDQYTSGDYVDAIAPMILKAILEYPNRHDVLHIGSERKSIYDLAKQTRNVGEIYRKDVKVTIPYDTSLNLDKWKEFINEH